MDNGKENGRYRSNVISQSFGLVVRVLDPSVCLLWGFRQGSRLAVEQVRGIPTGSAPFPNPEQTCQRASAMRGTIPESIL